VSSNKCVHKSIMALKSNQLQVTTHKQIQSLSEYTKLSMIFPFDLERNHENLDKKEYNPFDC
jgi:hypothetical protein